MQGITKHLTYPKADQTKLNDLLINNEIYSDLNVIC